MRSLNHPSRMEHENYLKARLYAGCISQDSQFMRARLKLNHVKSSLLGFRAHPSLDAHMITPAVHPRLVKAGEGDLCVTNLN